MLFTERNSAVSPRERNYPVRRIVTDIRAAAECYPRADAPLLDDRCFVGAEIGVVRKDVGDAAQAQPAHVPDARARRHMKHRTVDPVEMLADVLDQKVDAAEVGLERGSQKV